MKAHGLFLIGLLSLVLMPGPAKAQSTTTANIAPNVISARSSWHKEVYVPALLEDPMKPNQQQTNLRIEQKEVKRANAVRAGSGQAPLPAPIREIYSQNEPPPDAPHVNYIYEAKITNAGTKTIKALDWEYSFADPETEAQVGCHEFIETTRIRAGKSITLVGYTTTPPTMLLAAKGSHLKYSEQVRINRIEYEDGTFWQRPAN